MNGKKGPLQVDQARLNFISVLIFALVIALQAAMYISPCLRFQDRMSEKFTVAAERIEIERNPYAPSYKVHMDYVEKAEKDSNCPEYEYLEQQFEHRQLRLYHQFKGWQQQFLFCLALAIVWELIGAGLVFRQSSSYRWYSLKLTIFVVMFLIPGLIILYIGPTLITWFAVLGAIGGGHY